MIEKKNEGIQEPLKTLANLWEDSDAMSLTSGTLCYSLQTLLDYFGIFKIHYKVYVLAIQNTVGLA